MKIVNEYPPNIEFIKKHFPVQKDTCYTYGDTLYNPSGNEVSPALFAHERIHSIQQKEIGNVDKWWTLYVEDEKFRLRQEIQGYRAEVAEFGYWAKDRNLTTKYAHHLANILASDLYGNIITITEAFKQIRV